ncbi:MAG: hypothetical protein HZA61_04155 [Candidatus Eisenbacteria bacterium]|uniref:Uncharacterized protein n=1 Tax=Eiseniibacteriota bacterium TaxID=2212470 RepID=A0A933SBC1_UNCEI|nr:hypothetical protein [Candidatus Eisenbacteria bacterium]
MNLLLPQTREAIVLAARIVDLHGDRFVDVTLRFDEPGAAPVTSRVSGTECPHDLAEGERVTARLVLGIVTRVVRPGTP